MSLVASKAESRDLAERQPLVVDGVQILVGHQVRGIVSR